MSSSKSGSLPKHLQEKRDKVILGNETVYNAKGVSYSGAYRSMGVDNSFSIEDFKDKMKIELISYDQEALVFDLIGVDAPIANALRRILISEVPTMAIENVWILDNSSIMQDEVLAHRLGLIPIKADPRMFSFKKPDGQPSPEDTIVFNLQVHCTRNPNAASNAAETEKYTHSRVTTKDLIWEPQEGQEERFESIRPVHDDILLVKLRPGQKIHLKVHCHKGIGKDHAKWSPVSTASYRLLPDILFKEEVKNEKAEELVAKCPMNVFDIEDLGKAGKRATVARPRACTMCRECIREPEWNERVQLGRIRDHFIFSIESTGVYTPKEIFQEAVKVLINKADTILKEFEKTG